MSAKKKGFLQWFKGVFTPKQGPKQGLAALDFNAPAARSTPFEKGKVDGFKGRANRYATRVFLSETAWKAASKAERAKQIRGGYTGPQDHGLVHDPYGKPKMTKMQLAFPGTPAEYKRGYAVGLKARKRGYV